MNRSALCIKMLMILKARKIVSTNELAQELETNPRNIREFKKELITAGYNIVEKKGRYGGYSLAEDCLFPSLKLTDDEIEALEDSRGIIKGHSNFENKGDFNSALDKILGTTKYTNKQPLVYLNPMGIPLSQRIKELMDIIKDAKEKSLCVELTYQKLNSKEEETYLIDPYEIVYYEDTNYLIAFSHKAKDYRTFRFSETRMKNCKLSKQKFLRDSNFKITEHTGKEHIINGEFVYYELWVKDKTTLNQVNELYWGPNYEYHTVKDGYICSFYSENKIYIYRQMFSLLDGIKILKPTQAYKEYKKMIEDILHILD